MCNILRIAITAALLIDIPCSFANSADSLEVQPGNMLGASTLAAQNQVQAAKNKSTFKTITLNSIVWQELPNNLPPGGQYFILEGDPKSSGMTTLRLKLPANYRLPPVFNQFAQRTTVLSGSINIGSGNKFDRNNSLHIPAGSYLIIPGNAHYYLWTTEGTVLQTTGMAILKSQYVNPQDNPRIIRSSASPAKPIATPSSVPSPQDAAPADQSKTPADNSVSTPTG